MLNAKLIKYRKYEIIFAYPAVPPIRNLIPFGVFVGNFAASDVAAGMDLDPIRFVSMPFRCIENKKPKKKSPGS